MHITTQPERSVILLLLIFLNSYTLVAQSVTARPDFSTVDSFVLKVKYENDYIKLARDLTGKFLNDIDKVRSIFKWITNNISYDFRFFNSGKEMQPPECSDKYDCAGITRAWENDYLKKILRSRKAVSDGYARLFQKLCEFSHIQTEIIPGYARTKPYQVGNKISANHAWNAVFIDTAWFFLDATWASGYCVENDDGKLIRFVKEYEDYYWINGFQRISRNHYPKNGYWGDQYHLSQEDFFNRPHYYSPEILSNISNERPVTGMLTVRKDDTLHFNFDYQKDIRYIQVNSNNFRNPSLWTTIAVSKRKTKIVRDSWAEKKQVYIPFKRIGNHYSFDYIVKDNSLYYVELLFDYRKAMRYKVIVTK